VKNCLAPNTEQRKHSYGINPVATGDFGGLSPPRQSSKSPQLEIWNTTNK